MTRTNREIVRASLRAPGMRVVSQREMERRERPLPLPFWNGLLVELSTRPDGTAEFIRTMEAKIRRDRRLRTA